jgi:hypothetical protein
MFLEQYRTPVGFRVSQLPLDITAPVVSLPLYAMERLRAIAYSRPCTMNEGEADLGDVGPRLG